MDEDFLDDEEELDEYYEGKDEEDSDDDEASNDESSDTDPETEVKEDTEKYKGKMTETEVRLSLAYDDLVRIGSKGDKDSMLSDALTVVVGSNPKHTNAKTINDVVKDLMQKQGHNRMVNSVYVPETALRGEDVDADFLGGDGDYKFNKQFAEEARELVTRFIKYLAERDLSKDDAFSKRRKQRQIPAFIIFLFSSGLYDLILNCPTLPKEYALQVENAFKKIMKTKYDIVEELARKYEEMGRPKVAERVRRMQLAWFDREPADIRNTSEYADLDLTYDDVVIYREFRSRFTNTSKSITQDVISNMIEVVIDAEAGIYERLKDKTRSEAISDVKQVWKNWIKENAEDSELGKKIIWKDVDSLKQ